MHPQSQNADFVGTCLLQNCYLSGNKKIMAANVQFSIAVHLMAGLACVDPGELTSAQLAASVNTSPSFVRRTLARLSHAGLVSTSTGRHGACRLGKAAERITLLDIYHAVEAPPVFAIHPYNEQAGCAVSCGIKPCLEKVLGQSQDAVQAALGQITLAQMVACVQGQKSALDGAQCAQRT